ncbi:unnamed protein product [Caenorhabditis bovis]|uniref:Uncharacterized protein n=1 Tax=Caenorhabditis bovis TaxID=2654633 RepID=A0A8S1FFV1_9PELO|nr:unnamed protein product [Caenorhabditis bovis]
MNGRNHSSNGPQSLRDYYYNKACESLFTNTTIENPAGMFSQLLAPRSGIPQDSSTKGNLAELRGLTPRTNEQRDSIAVPSIEDELRIQFDALSLARQKMDDSLGKNLEQDQLRMKFHTAEEMKTQVSEPAEAMPVEHHLSERKFVHQEQGDALQVKFSGTASEKRSRDNVSQDHKKPRQNRRRTRNRKKNNGERREKNQEKNGETKQTTAEQSDNQLRNGGRGSNGCRRGAQYKFHKDGADLYLNECSRITLERGIFFCKLEKRALSAIICF